MSFKKSMFIMVMAFGLLSACGDKKAKGDHGHAHDADEAKEMVKETSKTEAKIDDAKKMATDSLRKIDSLQQVKEHGHAH